MHVLIVLALLQQPTVYSSPPAGDTVGYWQQRASYVIAATLDEPAGILRAQGVLTYVNASPDTLRELWLHQHLNAFRPGSAFSAVDEREGRERFQRLPDPFHAYERFRGAPRVDGIAVTPEYPGAPDSTVVRLALPRPLPPGHSLRVEMAWDARLSTLPRRQGRRGRSFDFAHWYPRIAVYDRAGWQHNALVPAGEFYGEFGDFDVTLVVRDDQVLGTTGVVVAGDPGWGRVLRGGVVAWRPADTVPPQPVELDLPVPPGHRRVRVIARDVHHVGWSVSPDYRYEGAWFRRDVPPRPLRAPVRDSVAVHVLYRPADTAAWGNGQVLARSMVSLHWLESIFGPYPYPQMTVLRRIEGGGTEFPMLQMNGSPSQGLNLHEAGHIYVHGLLANNEWRAAWMDEGLTSYQTLWAQDMTPQERARQLVPPPQAVGGYRALAMRPATHHAGAMTQARHELLGRAQPIGTVSHEFSEFAVYQAMLGRAEWMFGALRDVMGDERFRLFLRLYYDRWVMRHVDELAMRRAASDAEGASLDWFFGQWVHRTGLVNYALTDADVRRVGDEWVTRARVVRRGEYLHPMAVGVRVDTGWVIGRAEAEPRSQIVQLRTTSRPAAVRLDPLETSPDWFRANHAATIMPRLSPSTSHVVLDWPFLEQNSGNRYVTALAPLAWYGRPGGTTVAMRARSNYQGLYDRLDAGLALATRSAAAAVPEGGAVEQPAVSRVQGWWAVENPMLPGAARPLMGVGAGAWHLDGITVASLSRRWDRSRFVVLGDRVTHGVALTGSYPYERALADGRRWSGRSATDVRWWYERVAPAARGTRLAGSVALGAAAGSAGGEEGVDPYLRSELTWTRVRARASSIRERRTRFFAGVALDAPIERALYLSALDPTATFANHLWRPDGGILSSDDVPYIPPGGGGLRGYDPLHAARALAAVNLEESVRLRRFGTAAEPLDLLATLFGDAGLHLEREGLPRLSWSERVLADAGVGLAMRGRLYDRTLRLRFDLPLYVRQPELAVGERGRTSARSTFAWRWSFSLNDLW